VHVILLDKGRFIVQFMWKGLEQVLDVCLVDTRSTETYVTRVAAPLADIFEPRASFHFLQRARQLVIATRLGGLIYAVPLSQLRPPVWRPRTQHKFAGPTQRAVKTLLLVRNNTETYPIPSEIIDLIMMYMTNE